MKRLLAALAGFFAIGWSAMALAQSPPPATAITTACPINLTCAFSAAETMSLVTPKPNTPGQPDVFVGYMVFDNSSNVTLAGLQNINGTVGPIEATKPPPGQPPGLTGSCAPGAMGQPALINFNDNSQVAFVIDASGTELQFILSQDKSSTKSTVSNSVRVGVCRKQ